MKSSDTQEIPRLVIFSLIQVFSRDDRPICTPSLAHTVTSPFLFLCRTTNGKGALANSKTTNYCIAYFSTLLILRLATPFLLVLTITSLCILPSKRHAYFDRVQHEASPGPCHERLNPKSTCV